MKKLIKNNVRNKWLRRAKNGVMRFRRDSRGEINIISMVLIIIVVIALVAIFQDEMTDIVNAMFDKIRTSMGLSTGEV